MRSLSFLLFAAIAASASAQTTLYVSSSAPAGGNGLSWSTAFNKLDPALAAAGPGTQVWVTSGLYSAPAAGYTVPAGVKLTANFLSGHQSPLQRSTLNRTVLSGGGGRVLTMGAGAELDGFFIQNGFAPAPGGGAVLIDGVDCEVRNCFFRINNDNAGMGAAILVRNGADPVVENCVLSLNGSPGSGATVDVDGAKGRFLSCTFDLGGAVAGLRFQNGATPTIANCLFTGNIGRGIEQVDTSANPLLRSCLFWGNTSALYRYGTTDLTTLAQVNALPFALGNLAADPLYAGPNDYRLQSISPAIDAGDMGWIPERKQCYFDSSRVLDGNFDGVPVIDIGGHEFAHVTVQFTQDTHRHIHTNIQGTPGLPVYLAVELQDNPAGLWLPPAGYLFLGVANLVIFPFGTLPIPPANATINYPPGGVTPYIPTYWQAIVVGANGSQLGFNLSNPQVHVTNP